MLSPLSAHSFDTDTIDYVQPKKMGPADQKVSVPSREGRGYSPNFQGCHHEMTDRTHVLRAVFTQRKIIKAEVCKLCGHIALTEPEDPMKPRS